MSGSRSTPQLAVREQAEHAQRRHHHRREDGVVDRDAGDPHGGAPLASGLRRRRRRRGSRRVAAEALAAGALRATTLACAPSFRLSKRAASICASARQPLAHLDPAARRVAPAGDDDAAHQRAVLDRPDDSPGPTPGRPRRIGTVSRCGVVGELDARLRVLAGAEALVLVVERDDDADRARAGLGRRRDAVDAARRPARRCPSTRTCDRLARRAAATPRACRPMPASSSDARSTIVSTCCSALTFSPGTTWRLPTMPEIGASKRRLARRRRARRASCACADLSWARAASSAGLRGLQRGRRDEVLRRQADVGGVLALGLDQRGLRRLDHRRALATRLCRSARSISPITWPALTRLPSATRERQQRAGRLGAHDRRARRHQRPGELDHQRHRRQHRPDHLGGDELERHRPPFPCPCRRRPAWPSRCRRAAPGPGPAAIATSPSSAPPTQSSPAGCSSTKFSWPRV